MIRVLHILYALNRGGIETFLMNIYRHIDREKVQFDFLINVHCECHYTKEIISLGGRIYDIPSRREGVLKRRNALNLFFKAHPEYKIVHQHSSSLSDIMPLQAATKWGVPIRIIHSHNTKEGGSKFHEYIHRFNQLFINKYATDFYACSDLAARWMYTRKQYINKNFTIIHNGIDLYQYKFDDESRWKLREEFGLKKEQLVIGNVSAFRIPKNHVFLLEIFAEFLLFQPDTHLFLVGDGDLRLRIESKIRELNISENVTLTGVRKDIPNLLSMFDVLLMPSLHEGLPVSVIEAQATGIPCVLSSAITSECKILDTLIFKSLTDSKQKWCDAITQDAHVGRVLHAEKLVADVGYDIRFVSKMLLERYFKRLSELYL